MPRFREIRERIAVKALPLPVDDALGWRFVPSLAPWPATGYDLGRHSLDANSVVSLALRWLRRRIIKGRIVVGREEDDGTYTETKKHPLTAKRRADGRRGLLRRPNPYDSWRATLGGTSDSLALKGYAYWLKARDPIKGEVEQLHWIPNHQIRVMPEGDPVKQQQSGPIRAYRYLPGTRFEKDYPPADVVHFRDGRDPLNRWQGLSELERQLRNAASVDFAERYTNTVLRNAHAGKFIAPEASVGQVQEASPEEAEMIRVRQRIQAGVSDDQVGGITNSTLALKVHDLGMGPDAMALDRILDWPVGMILAFFGLNMLTLNLPGGHAVSTFANKAEANREAYEDAVIPRQDLIADEIEAQLLGEFDGPEADSCWWDRRDVEELQEDANARATRAVTLRGGPVASEDEARALVDLPPGPAGSGGDLTPVQEAARGAELARQIAEGQGREADAEGNPFSRNGARD